jgi:hypothetical protein
MSGYEGTLQDPLAASATTNHAECTDTTKSRIVPEHLVGFDYKSKTSHHPAKKRPRSESSNTERDAQTVDMDESSEEEEAGLSLLFEASLLQQPKKVKQRETEDEQLPLIIPQPIQNSAAETLLIAHSVATPTAASSETATSNDLSAFSFTNRDVLCGRGGQVNKHIGNIIYRYVVEKNKSIYRTVPKRHRMLVSQSIVQSILNRGGRFMSCQKSSGSDEGNVEWFPIHYQRAVAKTSQALREPPIHLQDLSTQIERIAKDPTAKHGADYNDNVEEKDNCKSNDHGKDPGVDLLQGKDSNEYVSNYNSGNTAASNYLKHLI